MHHSTIKKATSQVTCTCCRGELDPTDFMGAEKHYHAAFINKVENRYGAPVCTSCMDDNRTCPQCGDLFLRESENAYRAETDGELCCSDDCAFEFDREADADADHIRSARTH